MMKKVWFALVDVLAAFQLSVGLLLVLFCVMAVVEYLIRLVF